ncbi:MAG: small multi-drug export protein [Candidatus Aminicenantes bacterium]|nr:small multi-drug export protein [Candidatus Aminicenantes bacterium]
MSARNIAEAWKLAAFFGIQYVLGRRCSYPYGIVVGYSLLKITLLVFICDITITFALLILFEKSAKKIPWLKKKRDEYAADKPGKKKKNWLQRLKKNKAAAIILITAFPYGGGVLTGSIFAFAMKIPIKKSFFLIIIGSIICSLIFHLGFAGILALIPHGF